MSDINRILSNAADDAIAKLLDNYNSYGLKASGDLGRSFEKEITQMSQGFKLVIKANHYAYFLEYGRKPTTPSKRGRLYKVILEWAKNKGIQTNNIKRFAYFASKKIDEKGINVPNKYNKGKFLTSVINDEWINNIQKQLTYEYISEIKSQIIKTWQ